MGGCVTVSVLPLAVWLVSGLDHELSSESCRPPYASIAGNKLVQGTPVCSVYDQCSHYTVPALDMMISSNTAIIHTSFPLKWYPYSLSNSDIFCTLTASLKGVASPISPLLADTCSRRHQKDSMTCSTLPCKHSMR